MTELAIDRFRAKGLDPQLEQRAQKIADELGGGKSRLSSALVNGWLSASIALALEHPRGFQDRLAIDLRVIEILRERGRIATECWNEEHWR